MSFPGTLSTSEDVMLLSFFYLATLYVWDLTLTLLCCPFCLGSEFPCSRRRVAFLKPELPLLLTSGSV